MLLQNVFCTRLMPVDRPLKAAFAIFPTQGSRHHKYDTNVCKKGRTPMYTIDFTKPVHIHFIGIGGISMSGLAEILLKEGFTVSGSDSKESALTDHLTASGAQIFYGQRASNIIDGIDLVVYTAAIHPPGICLRKRKKYSDDDPCRSAGTDHEKLPDPHRSIRNPRKNHNNFHGFSYSPGRWF